MDKAIHDMDNMINEMIPKKSNNKLKLKTISIPNNFKKTSSKEKSKKYTKKTTTTTTKPLSIKAIETVKIRDEEDFKKYETLALKGVKPKISTKYFTVINCIFTWNVCRKRRCRYIL